MPCHDGDVPDYLRPRITYELNTMRARRDKFEAALCATMKVLEAEGLIHLPDWQEAGVSRREIEAWWLTHKKQDRLRKLQKQETRKAALAKLTPKEREALGLK